MKRWWIAVALGHRYFAIWGDGTRDSWSTDKVSKGPVFGINVGRKDGP